MSDLSLKPQRNASTKKIEFDQVLAALQEYCAALSTGERVPTRSDLMKRFDASERTVMRALDELRREGVLTARAGSGTFVTGVSRFSQNGTTEGVVTENSTVVAIGPHDYSFFDRCMHLLLRQAEAADLTLVCRLYDAGTNPLRISFDVRQTVGVVLFRYDLAPLAKQLRDAGYRVVIVGVPPADVTPEVPSVYADHEQSGYLATRHLLDLGHRRIAFLGDETLLHTMRWRGNQRAIREAQRRDVVQTAFLPIAEVNHWQAAPQSAIDYFRHPQAPTGVVVWNDHQALTLLGTLQRAGIKVPDDVSVVGHDDLPEARLLHPALTTVNPGIEQQLQAALGILTRPVAPPASHTVVVLPNLNVRESSAGAK